MNLQKNRLWTPTFCILFLQGLLSSTGFYMITPTLPQYAVSIGMSLSEAGVLVGLFSLVAIFARPLAGILSDRSNKKWLMVITYIGMGTAAVAYGFVADSLPLYVCRILHGCFFAISSTASLALAADIVPSDRLGEGLGYIGTTQIISMSFAPSVGLMLADSLGYQLMFALSGILIGVCGIVMVLFPYVHAAGAVTTPRKSLKIKDLIAFDLILLAIIGGLFSLLNGVLSTFLPMLGDERGIGNIALFFTVSSIVVLAIRPIIGRTNDKNGFYPILIPALVLGAASLFIVSGSWGIVPILIAAVFKGASQSSGQLAVQTECIKRKTPQERGVAISTCYLGNDLGNSLGSAYGGWVSETCGNGIMFSSAGVLVLLGLGLLWVQRIFDKKKQMQARHTAQA